MAPPPNKGPALRYAVILLANSAETSIFVYQWLYEANKRVEVADIQVPPNWVDKKIPGDIRLLPRPARADRYMPASQLTSRLEHYLDPLIKHAGRFLTNHAGDVPLKLVFDTGTVDKELYSAVQSRLWVVQCSKRTRMTLVDTGNPEDLVGASTAGATAGATEEADKAQAAADEAAREATAATAASEKAKIAESVAIQASQKTATAAYAVAKAVMSAYTRASVATYEAYVAAGGNTIAGFTALHNPVILSEIAAKARMEVTIGQITAARNTADNTARAATALAIDTAAKAAKAAKVLADKAVADATAANPAVRSIACAGDVFAAGVTGVADAPGSKKYVAILVSRRDGAQSINIYDSSVTAGGLTNPVTSSADYPVDPEAQAAIFADVKRKLEASDSNTKVSTVPIPLLLLIEPGARDPALADTIRTLWNHKGQRRPYFRIMKSPAVPRDKIGECYSAQSNGAVLRDIACRFLTMATHQGIVLDAGSEGTRIFVYNWSGCVTFEKAQMLPEDINMPYKWELTKSWAPRGIDTLAPLYTGDSRDDDNLKNRTANQVADYLNPLFDYARMFLTKEAKSIPVYLLATDGMEDLQIWNRWGYGILVGAIRCYVGSLGYDSREHELTTVDNKALYGWVAANYLSGTLTGESTKDGFLETRGENMQIAFAVKPDVDSYNGSLAKLDVEGKEFNVFSKTLYRLGADRLLGPYMKKIDNEFSMVVKDPCLPIGCPPVGDKTITVGTSNFDACVKEILSLMQPDVPEPGRGGKFLMKDGPQIEIGTKFSGSSVFLYATHGMFPGTVDGLENYQLKNAYLDIKNLFATSWSDITALHPPQQHKNLEKARFRAALVATTLQHGFGVKWDDEAGTGDQGQRDGQAKIVNTNFYNFDATWWTLGMFILHVINRAPEMRTKKARDNARQYSN